MEKINIITLGCSKNLVDSEVLATYLRQNHFVPVFDKNPNAAKYVVINTCGFIHDAKEESIDKIFEFVDAKLNNKVHKVVVMGCLSERYKSELVEQIPEIDGVFGVSQWSKVIEQFKLNYEERIYGQRLISTPSHYAYLKISEGCNRRCSFCAIPSIRGKYISTPLEALLAEGKYLAAKGVKELLLVAQDTSYYGSDLYGQFNLHELVGNLLSIRELEWVRLHYLYPSTHLLSIIDLMSKEDKICNYIDIPFQHISDRILKSMRRGHTSAFIRKNIELFRSKVPEVALRTTMIIGYPNETDRDFRELLDFVSETKFDRLGAFIYSAEAGTRAAKLKDNIPARIKKQRFDELMNLQGQISLKKNQEKVGKIYKVMIDSSVGANLYVGRTEYDSPEVDNEVLINNSGTLKIGNIYNVKIIKGSEYDLEGNVVFNS